MLKYSNSELALKTSVTQAYSHDGLMSKYRHLVEFCHWSIRVGGRVAEGRMKL